ncbi:hypothetical protein [Brevibacillus fulvus]|uniref:Membrane protein YszA n=1 Tax=Brevibacillus fulvus TaxID=1125967 RepID=A0A938XY72_9BACL|nr:hypothetical protein [Brevibacillus fulvus]MBM7590036.1 hypothetical protein [Brevibacillus fulvus]
MNFRWKYHPTYLRIKFFCRQILLPLIVFQFIRTMLLPTTFDVVLLGLLAVAYVAIYMEWV